MEANHISRRSFLARSASAAAAIASSSILQSLLPAQAQPLHSGNPVQFPPDWTGGSLTAAPAEVEVWPGYHVPMLALNGSVPAPTIRVKRHRRFAAQINNALDEHLVLHWHGILAPASMDGHPHDTVDPGQSYSVDFAIPQQAGTYWYHAHTHGHTGKQLYFGLAGFFIVEDPAERRFNLPNGDHDLPLLIQDKRTHGEKSFIYDPHSEMVTGFLGDEILVNNTPEAYLSVDQGLYRFRLVNGSNARVFRLGFRDAHPFHLIANDAGLLTAPIEVTSVFLAPGQRAEILVDFGGRGVGEAMEFLTLAFAGGGPPPGGGDGGDGMEIPRQGAEMPVMTFCVDNPGQGGVVPGRLARVQEYNSTEATRTRVFVIETDGTSHFINGAPFDMDRIDLTVPFGDLEIWEYQNLTSEMHPMHPHGVLMQVLERVGANTLLPEDTGWKDTVLVRPGATVRVLIRFDSHPGVFVHHCHNLEHGDMGMMQNVEVQRRRR